MSCKLSPSGKHLFTITRYWSNGLGHDERCVSCGAEFWQFYEDRIQADGQGKRGDVGEIEEKEFDPAFGWRDFRKRS